MVREQRGIARMTTKGTAAALAFSDAAAAVIAAVQARGISSAADIARVLNKAGLPNPRPVDSQHGVAGIRSPPQRRISDSASPVKLSTCTLKTVTRWGKRPPRFCAEKSCSAARKIGPTRTQLAVCASRRRSN
jgi:hypothetical protein